MAVLFYATTWMTRQRYSYVAISTLIAVGFHTSAIIGVGIFVSYLIGKKAFRKTYAYVIAVGVVIMSFFDRQILIFIVGKIGILPARYISSRYLYASWGSDFIWSKFLYVSVALCIVIIIKPIIEDVVNYYFLLYMILLSMVGVLIGGTSEHLYRITWYCEIYSILIFSLFSVVFK